jgi:hypothetical protein
MPETSGRGAELLALSGYNGRAVQTKKERSLTWGNGSAGKTRIYFRPFEGGVALLGAAAFAAVGPWRGAFAGLPWVTVASTFVLFLAQGALLVRWSLREYLSGAALPPAAFVYQHERLCAPGGVHARLAVLLVVALTVAAVRRPVSSSSEPTARTPGQRASTLPTPSSRGWVRRLPRRQSCSRRTSRASASAPTPPKRTWSAAGAVWSCRFSPCWSSERQAG